MSELVLVVTHFNEHERAQKIARRMIRAHLAASAQIAATEKIYYWHGQWREVQRWTLMLASTQQRYRALEAALRAAHHAEDETPTIFALPCCEALPAFSDWVASRVLENESTASVRPSQTVNFPEAQSSMPPLE